MLGTGEVFEGVSFGGQEEAIGEVVFNTGMTGYQEILTDPSYAGQIVNFTYPIIGNYGINEDDFESDRMQPSGIIVREVCEDPSNWRSNRSLSTLMTERNLTGIAGIDTRAITMATRERGATMGLITTNPDGALQRLNSAQAYQDREYVRTVTTKAPYAWGSVGRESIGEWQEGNAKARIIAIDCGLKYNILRRFAALGVKTLVVPALTPADEILEWSPDAVLLSPGPGDPARLEDVIETVRQLIGRKPLFGICLGNQMLCHAVGGTTFKMKFGHRGSNHPVKDLLDGTVTITSQNHGFAVDPDSLAGTGAEITQVNLNDGTVEGIRLTSERASSIQYHPEAAPGPWDSRKYFTQFIDSIT